MNSEVRHPNLYQVNTRVLLRELQSGRKRVTLTDIPDSYWQNLQELGMQWVWLMGVWTIKEKQHNPNLIPLQMMSDFRELLPDLKDEDISGSTFAIDDYQVDPMIGGRRELSQVRTKLNALGMQLMLDFIPNHYGAHTRWLRTHPEYFVQVTEDSYHIDQSTFYKPSESSDQFFAHGKDPYFAAWQDTVQVDFAFSETRQWMTQQLLKVADQCDGVRCDMAMLPVRRIFQQTWTNYVKWNDPEEFWPGAIQAVKDQHPGFKMLAEVYWDMEGELLEMGFDFCYDKTFYDRLLQPAELNAHFKADTWYLDQTARFLENHDEERIATRMGLQQQMAAAALIAFGPGLRFWHMGQFEGRRKRTPVQLNRQPLEACGCTMWQSKKIGCACLGQYYRQLLGIASNLEILRNGQWKRLNVEAEGYSNLFLWQWEEPEKQLTVAINYSDGQLSLDPNNLGLTGRELYHPLVPPVNDAYNGMQMAPWAVKVWESK